MKRNTWKRLLCAGFLGTSLLVGANATASVVTDRVPMLTYADHTVPTYDKPGGKQRGFISPNVALVWIRNIRADGWAYGSYPIAGGKRVYRWFQMQELQGFQDFENYPLTIKGDQTVYRTSAQAAKTGHLLNKQEVLVVGAEGKNFKVIYRVDGSNEWKMGWIGKKLKNNDEEENEDDAEKLPITINVNIENNPNIQNNIEVTNTNENHNENTNENKNENKNENTNMNTNNNNNQ